MKKCGDCFYYWHGNCYYDDVYHVERDNRACEDYLNKLCCNCNTCIWATFSKGRFTCHKKFMRYRRACPSDAVCHYYKESRFEAWLDPRLSAPRRCKSSIMQEVI